MRNFNQYFKVAERFHAGQMYGEFPYTYHLFEVFSAVRKVDPKNDVALIAALFHDILEDTAITKEELLSFVSPFAFKVIENLTDPEGQNRRERKQKLYDRFKNLPIRSEEELAIKQCTRLVKLADRLVNHQSTIYENNISKAKMYLREFPTFSEIFFAGTLATEIGSIRLFSKICQTISEMEVMVWNEIE